jgi:putative heme-binding domain-containing protein
VAEAGLADPHFAVRTHAVRVAEPWLDRSPGVLAKLLGMVDDPDAKVRLQLALSLGESTDGRVLGALAELAARHGGEPWMTDAVLSSVPDRSGELMGMLLARPDDPGGAAGLLGPLASVAGVRRDDDELGRVLECVAGLRGDGAADRQGVCLGGLVEGLGRGKPKAMFSARGQEALGRLLRSPSGDVRRLAVNVAGLVMLRESAEMRAALDEARETAFDRDAPPEDRAAAVALLASAPFAEVSSAAGRLLDAREPLPVQLAAVEAVAASDNAEVAPLLLDAWPSYTPQVRSAVLEAIFGRENRLPGLLDALEAGHLERSALDAARRGQLTGSRDARVRRRAEALFAGESAASGRAGVLARYREALSLPRDAPRGEKVFDRECAKCHKLAGRGFEVGPDLSVIKTRADETLISDVMDPSAQITVGYHQYTVLTEDGRIFTGVLAGETATSITLRKEEGAEQTILRGQVDEMEATTISMMPEDLEKQVTPQDVADLIAFLRAATGSGPTTTEPVVTLFDDDPAFAALLTEGAGELAVQGGDSLSGRAALAVTPPQRYSADIPGWGYRIVENPGPGEFRYLRFAWKSRGARGVMLELAAEGRWPPAGEPLRRYYSGRNTTGWEAVQVAADAPQQWTVVTRDLWQDFGPMVLTGIAPTAMGGEALFDRIELLRSAE